MTASKNRFRICAVCGKRHGSTQGYKTALRMMGHPNWEADKAVAACVVKYARQIERSKREASQAILPMSDERSN